MRDRLTSVPALFVAALLIAIVWLVVFDLRPSRSTLTEQPPAPAGPPAVGGDVKDGGLTDMRPN